ncbi:MAG TPA: citrate synthase [Deltaproteobacteria bacterium]|nr:citrate synthase [Deltaproteobacteria bacterium]
MSTAKLIYEGQEIELPVVEGSEGEIGIDISRLRRDTGLITLDPGYGNTGSCRSAITFIDGEKGILRYRGYPIEQVANNASFTEVCHLLIHGERPNAGQLDRYRSELTRHTLLHEDMKKFFEGYPPSAHPMAILAAMVASLSTFYPDTPEEMDLNIIRILAKSKTLAAFAYKKSIGQPFIYPRNDLSWTANFLRMMFAVPSETYEVSPVLEEALNLLLILHADHEQNCSTSTMRMVGSSEANLYASISAAICALWGPRHGGANQRVIEMLEGIAAEGGDLERFLSRVRSREVLLMGFGHRVYKNFDPRARLLKAAADRIFDELGIHDPLLDLAKRLEEAALRDEFFIDKKLYPNVDFYSGIIYRAMGIPTEMFTVMFALGRLPGWIAHWKEMREDSSGYRIHRPRQIYTGENLRKFE